MLKEKIFYKEGLPLNCWVADMEDYPIHFHDDIEVAYVLEGSMTLKNGYYIYTMEKGDMFILNDREIHSYYRHAGPNLIMVLQLDLNYFCRYYESLKDSFFVTDMNDRDDESLEHLRDILARILLEVTEEEPGYQERAIGGVHELIDSLMANFQYFSMEDGKFVNDTKNKGNKILAERMRRITEYLYQNYTGKLTLSEVAEREHLSIYYLSHVIKAATGLSFQELLGFIRVEESEKLLLGTQKKIGTISMEVGFSAVRYYIKDFIKWFGLHPEEYRKTYTGMVSGREVKAHYKLADKPRVMAAITKLLPNPYLHGETKKSLMMMIQLKEDGGVEGAEKWKKSGDDLLRRECFKPASECLELFLGLGEEQIGGKNHCILSRPSLSRKGAAWDRLSILFHHFDEKLITGRQPKDYSFREARAMVEAYQEETDLLLKFKGLSGEYRISRYTLPPEVLLARYDRVLGNTAEENGRKLLTDRWRTMPQVSFETRIADGVLNVQSHFSGSWAELVIIDRITPFRQHEEQSSL